MNARTTASPYPTHLLAQLRGALVAARDRADKECGDLGAIALRPSGQDSGFEEPADFGSEEYAEAINLDLLERESDLLREIDAAIARLDGETDEPFGLCEDCADQPRGRCPTCPWIAAERLLESPWVRRCAEIQREDDGQAGEG